MGKVILWILALIPVVLSLGGMVFAGIMVSGLATGSFDDNPMLKSFTYISLMVISGLICGFLYASYKIFSYIRNNSF